MHDEMIISEESGGVAIVVPQQPAQELLTSDVAEIHICFGREILRRTSRSFMKSGTATIY